MIIMRKGNQGRDFFFLFFFLGMAIAASKRVHLVHVGALIGQAFDRFFLKRYHLGRAFAPYGSTLSHHIIFQTIVYGN